MESGSESAQLSDRQGDSPSGSQVSKDQLVRAWQNNLNPRMSGHSARRSGAMMYTRKGLGIYDISFLGRWKSSAVLRYIEGALEATPLNRPRSTDKAMTLAKEIELAQVDFEEGAPGKKRKSSPQQPAAKSEAAPSGSKMASVEPPIDKSQLFVVFSSPRGKMRHTVANAGWGIPLDKWTTTCGWPFARYHVKVELMKYKTGKTKECIKCKNLEAMPDKVKGGWRVAQTADL